MSHSGKVEVDVHINASAENFYEFYTGKPHHIVNVSPGKVNAVTVHEGDWGKVGSILFWNYVHDGKTCVTKTEIEAIDPTKKSITLKIIESHTLEHHKSFKLTIQAIPKEKGCVVHWTFEYEKVHGQIPDPHSLIQLATDISRDIDSHLTEGHEGLEEQLAGKVEVDVHIDASAQQFHEMFTSRPHHLPNISPGKINHAAIDSDWGKLGSVITWHYVHDGKNCVDKEVIHAIDPSKNLITLRAVEGDILKDFKRMDRTLEAIPKEKGCVVHVTIAYEKLKGHILDPHSFTQLITDITRDMGSHLALI